MLIILIEGYLFCLFFMDYWGRRPILTFTQIVSGLACIFAALISNENFAGKFFNLFEILKS